MLADAVATVNRLHVHIRIVVVVDEDHHARCRQRQTVTANAGRGKQETDREILLKGVHCVHSLFRRLTASQTDILKSRVALKQLVANEFEHGGMLRKQNNLGGVVLVGLGKVTDAQRILQKELQRDELP